MQKSLLPPAFEYNVHKIASTQDGGKKAKNIVLQNDT